MLTGNALVAVAANNPALLTVVVVVVVVVAAASVVGVNCIVIVCIFCVAMLSLEAFVTEDVNDTFDVSLTFFIAVVSILLVKPVLTIGARIVAGANNLELLIVVVVVVVVVAATLAPVVGVENAVIYVSFNAMLVVISRLVACIDSFPIVGSRCLETGVVATDANSDDVKVSTQRQIRC